MHKKFFIVVAILIILCYVYWSSADGIELLDGKKTVYLQNSSSLAQIVTTDGIAFNKTGISVELEKSIDIDDILTIFNANVVFSETTIEGISYYAYSNQLKYTTIINGKRINLHVHYSNEKVVVGSPIIFGCF